MTSDYYVKRCLGEDYSARDLACVCSTVEYSLINVLCRLPLFTAHSKSHDTRLQAAMLG